MPTRITFVISSLGPGGAEHVCVDMCNFWARQGVTVHLLNLDPTTPSHYELEPSIERVDVDFFWPSNSPFARVKNFGKRLWRLRQSIIDTQPDVVISFVDKTNVRVLICLLGQSIPVIVAERSVPEHWPIGRLWHILRKLTYRKAAALVVQTQGAADWASTHLQVKSIEHIPNAVRPPTAARGSPTHRNGKPAVMAMGRLSQEKGFDLLLQAWSKAQLKDSWCLLIAGAGPEAQALENLCNQLELGESVEFIGLTSSPEKHLLNSDIFVLPSRFEGFPNALLEAMACGCACIAFDCDFGPREILHPDVDGMLVPAGDVRQLAAALDHLASDESLRRNLARQALDVANRFDQTHVMARWDNLIDQLTH